MMEGIGFVVYWCKAEDGSLQTQKMGYNVRTMQTEKACYPLSFPRRR